MADRMTAVPQADVREVAAALFQQGRRCAEGGLREQGRLLLTQAWSMAGEVDSALADRAAWEMAWRSVEDGDYAEAAVWFERMVGPPRIDDDEWPAAQARLLRLCRSASKGGVAVRWPPGSALSAARPPSPLPSPALPPLNVYSLGRFQITRSGAALPVCKARKALAVFRYLLTTRHHAADKEELMDMFWQDVAPREAAHSLHVAISALRRYLDPLDQSYIRFEVGRYLIEPEARVENDAGEFARRVEEGDRLRRAGEGERARDAYAAAVALYHGDYEVEDLNVAWAMAERERLLVKYLGALDHLGRLYMREGRNEAAAQCYRVLLERDNYREDAHGRLMRCYLDMGRRSEALRQYELCAAILARDLGLEPMPQTQALYRQALSTAS